MTREEISALLGRPLTSYEDTNFETYLEIAKQNLGELICTDLCGSGTRTFDVREGYTTAFIDIFTDVFEVKINGNIVTNYSKRQWDKRNASWYTSLVFTKKFTCHDEIEVDASWGFNKMPFDLQQVLAGLFGLITKKNKYDGTIASKQVEDFRISFNADVDLDADFYKTYGSTISKYSICDIPEVQSGKVKCKC